MSILCPLCPATRTTLLLGLISTSVHELTTALFGETPGKGPKVSREALKQLDLDMQLARKWLQNYPLIVDKYVGKLVS